MQSQFNYKEHPCSVRSIQNHINILTIVIIIIVFILTAP